MSLRSHPGNGLSTYADNDMNVKHKSLRARRLRILQPVHSFFSDIFGRVRIPRRGKRTGEEKAVEDGQHPNTDAFEG